MAGGEPAWSEVTALKGAQLWSRLSRTGQSQWRRGWRCDEEDATSCEAPAAAAAATEAEGEEEVEQEEEEEAEVDCV